MYLILQHTSISLTSPWDKAWFSDHPDKGNPDCILECQSWEGRASPECGSIIVSFWSSSLLFHSPGQMDNHCCPLCSCCLLQQEQIYSVYHQTYRNRYTLCITRHKTVSYRTPPKVLKIILQRKRPITNVKRGKSHKWFKKARLL